ncbi:hypothetical protein HYS03_00145 [Candidatus Woesebacteria bacterium]|nr:hypothetical protein [Candidatus Woesebacteria bacterium]
MTTRRERIIEIENVKGVIQKESPAFGSLRIRLTPQSVVILEAGPIRIERVKKIEDGPVSKKFSAAFAEAAASLLNNNLPRWPNIPEETQDSLNNLARATKSLLASQGRKRLALEIAINTHDLSLLAESVNVNRTNWQGCKKMLEEEIQQVVNNYKEKQYKKKALRNHP